MVIAAGFFGSFLLFLALGLGALAVTAALDKSLGKERALLLYVLGVVALTWLMLRPTPPTAARPKPVTLKLPSANDPTKAVKVVDQPFSRDPLRGEDPSGRGLKPWSPRNPFQPLSDTNALPPERLEEPPSVGLPFPLPPTIPGVGAEAGRAYRGAVPAVKMQDGSKLPDVPADGFSPYVQKPEDVFDWIQQGASRQYVYVKEIDGFDEKKPEYEVRKWILSAGEAPPGWEKAWDSIQVTYAMIGSEDAARKIAADSVQVRRAKSLNVVTTPAEKKTWRLRRTVANQFTEACRAQGSPKPEDLQVEGLRSVAASMAAIGLTGKEDGEGWRRAVAVLEIALEKCARPPARNPTDVLLPLLEAHRALHDETATLRTLTRYLEANAGGNGAADGAAWLGELYLGRLQLPQRAVELFDQALAAQPSLRGALEGRGDARSWLGDHKAALKDYQAAREAGGRAEGAIREAEALLRLGRLAEAKTAADAALSASAFDPRALLVKGAIQYASGDVQGARDTFAQASALPGDGPAGIAARHHRAEALYDLGLAEWRLGHGDAAQGAFEAADGALRAGAGRGRSPGETVCPELGRALIQLGTGNVEEAKDALDRARDLTPSVAYVEVLSGWIASLRRDYAAAKTRLEAALRLDPALVELDPWLSEARLRLAQAAVAEGQPPSAPDFEAAVQLAERAAKREASVDPKSTDYAIRLALVQLAAVQISERRRFEAALSTAQAVIDKIAAQERRALAISGYCRYRLGVGDPELYGKCLNDFDAVLRQKTVAADDPWMVYVQDSRKRVVRWLDLREKVVGFGEAKLSNDWQTNESQGVKVGPFQGWLRFEDGVSARPGATADGSFTDPTVWARTKSLFGKDTMESVEAWIRVPKTNRAGDPTNRVVTFGVVIQPSSGSRGALAKNQGIGVFYDQGAVALRVGGGSDPLYKDGNLTKVQKDGKDLDWPEDPSGLGTLVSIERVDDDGTIVVRVGTTEILRDKLPFFKRQKSDLELWLGGWSTTAQRWDIAVDRIRVVRTDRRPQ